MLADRLLAPIDMCVGQDPRTVEYEVKYLKWEQKTAMQKLVKVAKETPKTLLVALPVWLLFCLFEKDPNVPPP